MGLNKKVSVIGGCNMDIVGFPHKRLIRQDSNPGMVKMSPGGVGRNIAENVALLGLSVNMYSALGNDINGDSIINSSKESGVNMDNIRRVDFSTGTYLAVLDENMDMDIAINSMEILKFIDIDYISSHIDDIKKSEVIVLDTNIHYEVFKYILEKLKGNKLFLDTVSSSKAESIKDLIGYFHSIKPNRIESEALCGIKIVDYKSLLKSAQYYHNQGVVNVCISMGADGVFFSDKNSHGIVKTKPMTPKNATGAGDAFQGGLVYSTINNMSLIDSVKFSIGASIMAMNSEETINKDINVESILEYIKEMEVITND